MPAQTTAQIAAAFAAAGLSPTQQAGVKAGVGYTPSSASSGSGNASVTLSTQTYLPGSPQNSPTPPKSPYVPPTAVPVVNPAPGTTENSPVGVIAPKGTIPVDPSMPSTDAVSAATSQLANDSNPQNLESGSLAYQDSALAHSQSIIDEIEKSFNSAISTAGGNAAAASAASGFAGSPEAGNMIANAQEPAIEARSNAVAQAALAIQSQASADYKTFISEADTNAQNTISLWQTTQKNLVATATSVWSTGVTPTSLKTSNPDEYSYLLQYAYNGDENAMNAAYVAASKANLLNNGQPVYQSNNQMVFAQYEGVNADGTPNIQFTPVTLPSSVPEGYKMQSNNQTANGQVITTFAPVDSQGNIIYDSTKPNGGIITQINGQTIGGPNSTVPANANPILSGQTIGNTTLGIVPNGVSETNAIAAQAIMEGKAPPPSSSTGSIASNASNQQMRAYMEANGYDLTAATEDWTAVQKWTSTENSTTVVRARVAADSAQQYITTLRGLEDQWNETNPLAPLDYAHFQSALSGALGQDSQNLAQKIQTQIADLTSDMGSVYRYGLSSTDSSMEQATQTLSTNWDNGRLSSSLDVIGQNLQVRINSLNSPDNAVSASGAQGDDNPYIGDSDSSTTVQSAGSVVEYNGQQYTVGADGNTLIPVSQ